MAHINEVTDLELTDLVIGKGQVRLRDVGKEIDELAASISKVGLLEPIVVAPTGSDGKYEVITGQRRFLAHKKLGRDTIMAAILDGPVDETTAKIISVTENLVRRDLNSKDLIDVCTELYKKYGSIKAVCDETGLPQSKVANFVKYDQLTPELKDLVNKGEVKIQTALKAQQAVNVLGDASSDQAVELAKEMESMSGAQQKKIIEDLEDDPTQEVDQAIEHAKGGGKITQVVLALTAKSHKALHDYSNDVGAGTVGDAAQLLIETALQGEGYL